MTQILFYHLSEKKLEEVLPGLLEKSLAREWNVVVESAADTRLEELDELLWTYQPYGFLPHGKSGDEHAADQKIWLTNEGDNPNGAAIRFLIDGADLDELDGYERIIYLFDGHDNASVEHARTRWKFHKDNNPDEAHEQTYWQQTSTGGWEKKA